MTLRSIVLVATLVAATPTLATEADDGQFGIIVLQQQRDQAMNGLVGAQVQIHRLTLERDEARKLLDDNHVALPADSKAAAAKATEDARKAVEDIKKRLPSAADAGPAPDTKEK